MRQNLLTESKAGFRLVLDPPARVGPSTATFDVVRSMVGTFRTGGAEAAAAVLVDADRAPDDEHLWAVVGELVSQLPASDGVAKALTAIQRNAGAIRNVAKGVATRRADADPKARPTLFDATGSARP